MEVVLLSLRQEETTMREQTASYWLVLLCHRGAAQKTHLTRKRATIGFCAREIKGPAFPIWLPCTLIDTLQGLPSINKSVSPTTLGFLRSKRKEKKEATVSTSHTALDISLRSRSVHNGYRPSH